MSQQMPNMTHFGTQVDPILDTKMGLEVAKSERNRKGKVAGTKQPAKARKGKPKAAKMEPQGRDGPTRPAATPLVSHPSYHDP